MRINSSNHNLIVVLCYRFFALILIIKFALPIYDYIFKMGRFSNFKAYEREVKYFFFFLSVQGTEIVCQVIIVDTLFPKWILYPLKSVETSPRFHRALGFAPIPRLSVEAANTRADDTNWPNDFLEMQLLLDLD